MSNAPVPATTRTLFVVAEKCVACKSCEIACAVEHSRSKTLLGALQEQPRPKSRIHIEKAGVFSWPSRCQHCSEAACITACPTGAMQRHAQHNTVFSDHDRCIGCWMCVVVCPFGGVTADPGQQKALKCDGCPERRARGEAPACASACPTGALLYCSPEDMARQRRQATARAVLNPPPALPANGMALIRALKGANT